jgi:hypothetical protein
MKSRILILTLAATAASALLISDIKVAHAVFTDPDNCRYNSVGRLTYSFARSSQPGREQQTSGGGHRKTSSGGHRKTQKRKHADADQSPIELRRSLFGGIAS